MNKIILRAQQQIGEDRSIFGLYHILQGRASIQTIQDIRLYHLSAYYGIYRKLHRKRFMMLVEDLDEKGYLHKKDADYYVLSKKGAMFLDNQINHETLHMNGEKYGQYDRLFFNRLQLLIQLWTNIKKGNTQFIPIIEDKRTVSWVKRFYHMTKTKVDTYLNHLYEELYELFKPLPDIYPELFLAQLSSYHYIGITIEQLALEHQLLKEDIFMMTTEMLHYMLEEIIAKEKTYPVLHVLLHQLQQKGSVTNSAEMTAHYLLQAYSIQDIAKKRGLKENTIHDHVVELAMHGHRSFTKDDYLTDELFARIEQAVQTSGSYRLKVIKASAGEGVSYFQIRLVLAMIHQSI